MGTSQDVVLIRVAPLRSQEANAMISMVGEWLKWPGEVKMQTLFFGYVGYGKWCYSCVVRVWIASI